MPHQLRHAPACHRPAELLKLVSGLGDIATVALSAIANLSKLGALRISHLQSASAVTGLATACAAEASTETRALALSCIAQAALDPACRKALASHGVPAHLVAAMDASSGVVTEARSQATQALAQFAADEEFRKSLSSWGALSPLCTQLSASAQPDARMRAMALSAIANVSFVDASELAKAGATSRLIEVLFDVTTAANEPVEGAGGRAAGGAGGGRAARPSPLASRSCLASKAWRPRLGPGEGATVAEHSESFHLPSCSPGHPDAPRATCRSQADPAMLRMALTAVSNLLLAPDAAASVVPQLQQSGGVLAIAGLLQNADPDLCSQALTTTMHACAHPTLVVPLAEAGAAPAVVGVLRGTHPSSSLGIVAALNAMCQVESARLAALEAGAAHTLSAQLLGSGDGAARQTIATALSRLLRGDWPAAYKAAGWPVLLAVLQLGPTAEVPQLHAEIAHAIAGLLADDLKRQALLPDAAALRFVAATLTPLVSPPASQPPDPALALGLAYALTALMRCGEPKLSSEAAATAASLAAQPALASALAQAGAAPLLVGLLREASPAAALTLARAISAMADGDGSSRAAVMAAGAVDALSGALLAATDADSKLSLSLTLAKVLRGNWQPAHDAGGWPVLLAMLLASAGSISPEMRQLAEGVGPEMLAALLQAQTAPAASQGTAVSAAAPTDPPVPPAVGRDASTSWEAAPAPPSSTLRGPQALSSADLD